MTLNSVGRQANQLDTSSGELWLEFCESTKFCCADWSVIFWMREENNPVVANEFMEIDGTGGSLSFEVWCNASKSQAGSC